MQQQLFLIRIRLPYELNDSKFLIMATGPEEAKEKLATWRRKRIKDSNYGDEETVLALLQDSLAVCLVTAQADDMYWLE